MKRSVYIIGTIVILLCIVSIVFFSGLLGETFVGGMTLDKSGGLWEEPGTYGPEEGLESVIGDASITVGEVVLRNTVISGDLYLEASIENEMITLQNVIVTGELKILGGSRVTIKEGQINQLSVNNENGAVTVITEGNAVVWNASIMSESQLEERSGSEALGFGHIDLTSEKPLTLSGNFSSLTIKKPGVINMISGKIDKVHVEPQGGGTTLTLSEQGEIGVIEMQSAVHISGKGKIQKAIVLANGSEMELEAEAYEFGEGISIFAGGATVDSSGRHEVIIETISDASVEMGKSDTKKVSFTPTDAQISVTSSHTGVATVTISGNTITMKGIAAGNAAVTVKGIKEGYISAEASFKVTVKAPKITMNSISNLTLDEGKTGSRSVTVNPENANISVKSDNTGVATVSLSGNTITINGKKTGTAEITVSASKGGYSNVSRKFTVTVKGSSSDSGSNAGSTPSFTFKVDNAILDPAKKLVVVTLNVNDPQNYNVTVGGHKIDWRFDSTFSGEIPQADAVKSKVKIVKK
ncbi:MAG: Ig-like domain-containing protein [Eubacteriales bacterium]